MINILQGNIIFKVTDLAITCLLLPFLGCYYVIVYVWFIKKKHLSRKKLALLSMGTDLQKTKQKFGSLDPLYEHNPQRYFDHVYIFWYPTSITNKTRLRDDITVIETAPVCNCFIYSGFIIFAFKVLRYVIQEQISLIRSTNPCTHGVLAWFVARMVRIPYVISIHADYHKRYALAGGEEAPVVFGSRRLAELLEGCALRRADIVLPIRDSLISYAKEKGAQTIHVIHHGIDLSLFKKDIPVDEYQEIHSNNRRIVSSACRLTRDNYIYDIIAIAEKVILRYHHVMFLIVGDGREYNSVLSQVKNKGLENVITLTGFLDRNTVITYRRISDVNIALMGGYSLIEAMASGKPTIAYDVEWHSELITDGKTGYLIPEGNIDMAVQRIIELLSDEKKAQQIGEAGRNIVFKKHDIRKTQENIKNIYAKLYKVVPPVEK